MVSYTNSGTIGNSSRRDQSKDPLHHEQKLYLEVSFLTEKKMNLWFYIYISSVPLRLFSFGPCGLIIAKSETRLRWCKCPTGDVLVLRKI